MTGVNYCASCENRGHITETGIYHSQDISNVKKHKPQLMIVSREKLFKIKKMRTNIT
jgi:hypothetical protein